MKPDFNTPIYWQGTKADPESLSYLSLIEGGSILFVSGGVDKTQQENATRIRDTWNACIGLDLPADVPPGALTELVRHARRYYVLREAAKRVDGMGGLTARDRNIRRKQHVEQAKLVLEELRESVGKLGTIYEAGTPCGPLEFAPPVSPPPAADTVPPGTLTHAAKLLAKWHNWIASGQLAFKPEDLEESGAVLRALGLPAMDRVPVSNLNPERQ